MHTLRKSLLPLLLVIGALFGLTAARPAQALDLRAYTCYVNLHYSSGTNKTASLQVSTMDSSGKFTGTLNLSNTVYTVTGTLTYWGNWSGYPWYTLTFDASYNSYFPYVYNSSMHFSGWLRDNGYGSISMGWGSFTWSAGSTIYYASGSGTFDGYGFIPPR